MPRTMPLLSAALLLGFLGCRSEAPSPDRESPSPPQSPPAVVLAGDVEATSLLGQSLLRPELDDDFRAEQEELLAQANNDLAAHPGDPDALIWMGRRTAYLGRYRAALEIFSRGITEHPEDARFYRHRGHRYITVRHFEPAIADLTRAAELLEGQAPRVEPDGLPNARRQPTGTTHSSVWYHLGLAHYLRGDFESALSAYRECLRFSNNPDMLVATSHWLYMTLRRLGRSDEAAAVLEPISADMDIIENGEYHRLLLMYRGEADVETMLAATDALSNATLGYGVGNWLLYNGDKTGAAEIFEGVLDGEAWAAFGYLAAEAEVARAPS